MEQVQIVITRQRKFFTFKRSKSFLKDFEAEEHSVQAFCQLSSICLEQTRRGEAQCGHQVFFLAEGECSGVSRFHHWKALGMLRYLAASMCSYLFRNHQSL